MTIALATQNDRVAAMSLVSRLIGLVSDAIGTSPVADGAATSDRTLAIAALLVHVARVDGRMDASEERRVADLLRERLGLPAEAASRLLSRAQVLDRATDDISDLVEMMGHAVPLAERRELVAMAYAVAAADGHIAEFEDDLIWRTGHLLGLDERDIAAAKAAQGPVVAAKVVA